MRDDLAHVIRAVEQGEQEIRLKGYITKLLTKLTDLIYAHQVMNVKMSEITVASDQHKTILTERDHLQGLILTLEHPRNSFIHIQAPIYA